MGTVKIKFLREGEGKMGLKRQSYPFRRMDQNGFPLQYEKGHLGRTNLIQMVFFLYSICDLFSEFRNDMDHMTNLNISLIRKLKDPVLEYIPESSEGISEILSTVIGNNNSSELMHSIKEVNSSTISKEKFLKRNSHVTRREIKHEIYNQWHGSTKNLYDPYKNFLGLDFGHNVLYEMIDQGNHNFRTTTLTPTSTNLQLVKQWKWLRLNHQHYQQL
jgi:hypothetical protein